MFGKHKSVILDVECDPGKMNAILKCNICNGEQVAGIKDLDTGKFTEVCRLIKNGLDLDMFMEKYNLSAISKEY